jgi:hypothetical protein
VPADIADELAVAEPLDQELTFLEADEPPRSASDSASVRCASPKSLNSPTDVENIAEQRSLEKAGFTREGILRHAQWRAGAHHDLVSYSMLREDL